MAEYAYAKIRGAVLRPEPGDCFLGCVFERVTWDWSALDAEPEARIVVADCEYLETEPVPAARREGG